MGKKSHMVDEKVIGGAHGWMNGWMDACMGDKEASTTQSMVPHFPVNFFDGIVAHHGSHPFSHFSVSNLEPSTKLPEWVVSV